jgi:FixJ family two-component response regulator
MGPLHQQPAYRPFFNRNRVLYILHREIDEGETIARAFGDQGFISSTARTLDGLARLIQLHTPDVVLLDVEDVVDRGSDVIAKLRAMAFGVRFFALTGDAPQASEIVRAVRSGALSVFVRPYKLTDMVAAVTEELRHDLRIAAGSGNDVVVGGNGSLSPREREVLNLILLGETNKEVAIALGISPRTVEVHRASAMRKMGAKNTAQLIRLALEA